MIRKNLVTINVKADREKQWSNTLDQELQTTVWANNCKSWYQNAAGKASTFKSYNQLEYSAVINICKQVTLLWSRSVTEFWWTTLWANMSDFEQVKLGHAHSQ
jgi:hypothetical protein